jgi:uncharacterized membrane protein (DUF373 family)
LSESRSPRPDARVWIARAFTAVEDIVYVGLGLILAGSALVLLATGAPHFVQSVIGGTFLTRVTLLLDRILLILLIVELLYTVQVSFREHAIVPEPFLIIGLIAAIRRVLVLTAELGEMRSNDLVLKYFLIEISALTVLILVLVAALVLLRRLARPLPSVCHLLERQFARYFDIIANRLYAHLTCQGCRATPSTDSLSA